jgi:hypothetical protein
VETLDGLDTKGDGEGNGTTAGTMRWRRCFQRTVNRGHDVDGLEREGGCRRWRDGARGSSYVPFRRDEKVLSGIIRFFGSIRDGNCQFRLLKHEVDHSIGGGPK